MSSGRRRGHYDMTFETWQAGRGGVRRPRSPR